MPEIESRAEWVKRLFGGARYEFSFGMRRGAASNWFRWDQWDSEAIAERTAWLKSTPGHYFVWNDSANDLVDSALELFPDAGQGIRTGGSPRDKAWQLAHAWEPDWLLLRRDDTGEFRLGGAAVCFPSSWDVREKLGRTVFDVHSIVPILNSSLGERIRSFLDRMPQDAVFERENWGLAASGERNGHPDRGLPRLTSSTPLEGVWFRLEHQAFCGLANGAGLFFVLRIEVWPLIDLLANPGDRSDFARMLETMPAEIAAYKGIAPARESLIRQMHDHRP